MKPCILGVRRASKRATGLNWRSSDRYHYAGQHIIIRARYARYLATSGRSRCRMGASIDSGNAPVIARRQYSRLLFELDLIAQGDAVGAHRRDLRLQARPAAINSTAVHGHQAEAAALVETQRIDVVVCRNYPQACAPLLPGQLPDGLDQRG